MSKSLCDDQHTGSEGSSDSDSDMFDDRDMPQSASTAYYDCPEFSDEEEFQVEKQATPQASTTPRASATPRASESYGALSVSPQHLEYNEDTNMTSASQAIAASSPPSLHHSQPASNCLGTQSPTSFSSGCAPNFGVSSFSVSIPYHMRDPIIPWTSICHVQPSSAENSAIHSRQNRNRQNYTGKYLWNPIHQTSLPSSANVIPRRHRSFYQTRIQFCIRRISVPELTPISPRKVLLLPQLSCVGPMQLW